MSGAVLGAGNEHNRNAKGNNSAWGQIIIKQTSKIYSMWDGDTCSEENIVGEGALGGMPLQFGWPQ